MTIQERIDSLISQGADIRMTSSRRGYSSQLPTGDCVVINHAILDQIESALKKEKETAIVINQEVLDEIKGESETKKDDEDKTLEIETIADEPKGEFQTPKIIDAKAVFADIIPKMVTTTIQLEDFANDEIAHNNSNHHHLDNLGHEDEDIDIDSLESWESSDEYGEAPQIPDKSHWESLTQGVESHLPPGSLESGLERLLITAVAMNPRQSNFDSMDDFRWEPGHYRVIFPILHKLFNSFDLSLPYIEDENGKPICYYSRTTGTWVNKSKYPYNLKCHLITYGPTGVGKSDSYQLAKRFIPVTDTALTNFQSVASFQRIIGSHFTVSASNPSIQLTNNECVEPLNPESENKSEKEHLKVLALGSHPSLVQRKTKDPNKGYPKRLAIGGYLSLGDLNNKGGAFKNESVQNALKQSGHQENHLWRPVAGVALPLGDNVFYGEMALTQLGFVAQIGLFEIMRRTMAIPVNPVYPYKENWKTTLINSLDWTGSDEWFEQYVSSKVRVVPSKKKFPLECHRAQFTRVKGVNRYPLAEKCLELQELGFLQSALSDADWHTLFIGTEYESNAKNSLTQFFLSLAAFISLEFPILFSGQLCDGDIAAEIRDTSPKAILKYRKEYSANILKSMFAEYYRDFSEMLRSVVREHNALSNGVESLKMWLSQRIDWLSTHDQLSRPVSESGDQPLVFDKAKLPGELLSQSSSSPFSLFYQAKTGQACKQGILPNGKPDPKRPPLVYNGNNASLSKDFTLAVSALGYVPDQESGCWILDNREE